MDDQNGGDLRETKGGEVNGNVEGDLEGAEGGRKPGD